jgi:hypothetical protein
MRTHFAYGGFMMIQPSEARDLCSKPEWELVESSFSPRGALSSTNSKRMGLDADLLCEVMSKGKPGTPARIAWNSM